MGTIDISYYNLFIGLLLLAIPFFYLWKFKTGLLKPAVIGTLRMIIQLFFIGMYLKYLFLWNNPWINFLWVIIMVFVAGQTALVRTQLKRSVLLIPITVGFLCSVVLVGIYFIGIVLQLDNIFSAQYFIPIFGILMGNMLSSNVIALNTYYSGLKREQQLYRYLLGNGATRQEAQAPFIRQAIIKSFSPLIANIAVMIGGSSGHDDRTNSGRKQPECRYQVSDDDYGDYFHSIYAIANDYYFIGFASIF